MVVITGNADGSSAVDYTVNPSTGFPMATGPRNLSTPFNHLLPAWDAVTGTLAATALLAAERHRRRTGEGQLIKIALSDVAFAMVGNLGKIAEVQINHNDRQKDGNFLYGAFGHDFPTKDGRRVMIVGLTFRQWKGLIDATDLKPAVEAIESMLGVDLTREGDRFVARDVIVSALEPWVRNRTLAEVGEIFDAQRCLVGSLPDLHSAGRRGPSLLAGQPDVRDSRPARNRLVSDARVAGCLRRRRAYPGQTGAGSRPAHRRGARRCPGPQSRRDRRSCTPTAWWPARRRRADGAP